MSDCLLQAILLLGPTGAGKTPLGDWLEANGLQGRPCHHLDFGACLRATAASGPSAFFTRNEIALLQRVLTEGALLEDESFHLAVKILDRFIVSRRVRPAHWLVLNGLPRHVGQAQALTPFVQVRAVIQLECDAPIVRERLRHNAGGDRRSRADDHGDLVARKLALYEERTRPLAEHYHRQGAQRISVRVGVDTRPGDLVHQLVQLPRLV